MMLQNQHHFLFFIGVIYILIHITLADDGCNALGDPHDWSPKAICKIGKEGFDMLDTIPQSYIERNKDNEFPRNIQDVQIKIINQSDIQTPECGIHGKYKETMLKLARNRTKEDNYLIFFDGCFVCPLKIPFIVYSLDLYEYYKNADGEMIIKEVESFGSVHTILWTFIKYFVLPTKSIIGSEKLFLVVGHTCSMTKQEIFQHIKLDDWTSEILVPTVYTYPTTKIKLCTKHQEEKCAYKDLKMLSFGKKWNQETFDKIYEKFPSYLNGHYKITDERYQLPADDEEKP